MGRNGELWQRFEVGATSFRSLIRNPRQLIQLINNNYSTIKRAGPPCKHAASLGPGNPTPTSSGLVVMYPAGGTSTISITPASSEKEEKPRVDDNRTCRS